MIETLMDLKNNKTSAKLASSGGGDVVERMKKLLSGLEKRRHGIDSIILSSPFLNFPDSQGSRTAANITE